MDSAGGAEAPKAPPLNPPLEKGRETGTCTSFRENQSASTSREREREREREMCVCVLFEFRHFFNSENSSTYFKVSCISLQKNLIDKITL